MIRRKTPWSRRVSNTILGGDTQSVRGFIFAEAIIPTIQNLVVDVVGGGIERLVYPDSEPISRARRSRGGFNDYSRYSRDRGSHRGDRYRDRDEPRMSPRGRANHDFDEIIIPSRMQAEEVLDRLMDRAVQYDVATVSTLYHLVGITSSYTDERYGWTEDDLRRSNIARAGREGYLLNLPRPRVLE